MNQKYADLFRDRFGLPPSHATQDSTLPADVAGILSHRTHRAFEDRVVSDDLLEVLFAAAFSAPSKSDLQQSSVVILRDPDQRRKIADLIPSMPWVGTAPVVMVFCGDSRRIRRICELRGRRFANDHLDAFLNAAVDCALTMQNFITAAEAHGLGCCPISVVRNHIIAVSKILALPSYVFPLAGLALGHPSRSGYISMRLPLSVTVHRDRYDDQSFPADVDDYDLRRDQRYSIPPEKHRDPEKFGQNQGLYGWSEDKARQVSNEERADLAAYLRRQGFRLE